MIEIEYIPIYALVMSGVSFLIAAALVYKVKDVDDEVILKTE